MAVVLIACSKRPLELEFNFHFIVIKGKICFQIPTGFSMMKKPLSETDFERLSITSGETSSNMMEKYAQENLNVHTRGILRKKVPVIDMISWTKVSLFRRILVLVKKTLIFLWKR